MDLLIVFPIPFFELYRYSISLFGGDPEERSLFPPSFTDLQSIATPTVVADVPISPLVSDCGHWFQEGLQNDESGGDIA